MNLYITSIGDVNNAKERTDGARSRAKPGAKLRLKLGVIFGLRPSVIPVTRPIVRHSSPGSESAYALLAHAFYSEYEEELPFIEKTPNGKPFFPDRPEIHISLSHCKTHVACVISDSPVGVDIESPREISRRAIKYFSSDEELALFSPLELWVLKESYIKLIGSTLAFIKHISFSRDNNRIIPPEAIVASKLYYVDGCTAAISSLGTDFPDTAETLSGSPDSDSC